MRKFVLSRAGRGWALGMALSALAFSSAANADTFAAKRAGVLVYEKASGSSKALRTLKKGDKVAAGERKGAFWSVEIEGGTRGFVRASDVTKVEDPKAAQTREAMSGETETPSPAQGAGGRARTSSSVMGVRGLDEGGDAGARANAKPDFDAVKSMERRKANTKRVDAVEDAVNAEIDRGEAGAAAPKASGNGPKP